MTPPTIPSTQLLHELVALRIPVEHIELLNAGLDVGLPSIDWILKFGTYFADIRPDYTDPSFICKQFVRLAAAEADLACLCAGWTVPHSFGEARGVLYQPGPRDLNNIPTSHAENIVRLDDGHWYLFEPQSCEDPTSITRYDPDSSLFVVTGVRV